jgi:hypothetical protein
VANSDFSGGAEVLIKTDPPDGQALAYVYSRDQDTKVLQAKIC